MMDQPLIERPEQVTSKPFHEMARAIEHNAGQGFGGAVVIVPPANGGGSIELLMLDSQGDVAQFYSTIMSRIQVALEGLKDKQRVAGGFGMR